MGFRTALPREWSIDASVDMDRRARLMQSISPEDLARRLASSAEQSNSVWKFGNPDELDGYRRVQISFAVDRELLDCFLNGPSGYRAQYSFSIEEGVIYNRHVIDILLPQVSEYMDGNQDFIRSLKSPHAKLWFTPEADAFPTYERAINLGDRIECRWRIVQIYPRTLLSLIGGFVKIPEGTWLAAPDKRDRAHRLFITGETSGSDFFDRCYKAPEESA